MMMSKRFRASLGERIVDPQDSALLAVALADYTTLSDRWLQWSKIADFDALQTGSILVPAIKPAIEGQTASPVVERVKGAYRKNWLHSQILMERVIPLLEVIGQADNRAFLADDLALALHYYPDSAMRQLFEVSVYARSTELGHLSALMDALSLPQAGKNRWRLTDQAFLKIRKVHAGFSDEVCRVETCPLPILGPTGQLWSSFTSPRPHSLMRLQDFGIVLRDFGSHVDWKQLANRARRASRLGDLRKLLNFYSAKIGIQLPDGAEAVLAPAQVSVIKEHGLGLIRHLSTRMRGRMIA